MGLPPDVAETLAEGLAAARSCRLCEEHLPLGPNPIVRLTPKLKILLVSQAPGAIAHRKTLPYMDPSGRRLREWLGVDEEEFYGSGHFGILPMGFCYPGKAGGGDAPPRPECAPTWHTRLLGLAPKPVLTVLIGAYAQEAWLGKRRERTLGATVRGFRKYWPEVLPLPHPSPRNNIWLRKNPWFEEEVLPALRGAVREAIT